MELALAGSTADERKWMVVASSDVEPGERHLYDRDSKSLTKQYQVFEQLPRDIAHELVGRAQKQLRVLEVVVERLPNTLWLILGSMLVAVIPGVLLGVLSAKQMGAERIVLMSRHEQRQRLGREFGATDVVTERGDEGVARIRELTNGVGADSVLECVGTGDSMSQAFASARPGGTVGFVGVPHGVEVPIGTMFRHNVRLTGGVAPVRAYIRARDVMLSLKPPEELRRRAWIR